MYPRINIPSVQLYLSKARENVSKARENVRENPRFQKAHELATRNTKLTLGVTAASVVAVTGIATGVATASSPAAQAGHPAAISQVDAVHQPRTMQKTTSTSGHTTHVVVSKKDVSAPAPAKHKNHPAPAKHKSHPAPARHKSAPSGPTKPYLVYDSVTPSAIPSGKVAAAYATGGYAASADQLKGHGSVVWIDTNGSDPKASALDVEPGDATPTQAAAWAKSRLGGDPQALARIYTMRSEWGAVKAAVGSLPGKMQSHIRWWIADPTGSPHVVPGAAATQWYWGSNYDISTATPRF